MDVVEDEIGSTIINANISSNVDSDNENDIIDTGMLKHVSSDFDLNVDICRVCLSATSIMRGLFHDGDAPSLADRLMTLANVKMRPGDGLPSQICCKCEEKLDFSYNFKIQVEESENILKQKLDSFNIKEESYFHDIDDNFTNNKSSNEDEQLAIDKHEIENHLKFIEDQQDKKIQDVSDTAEVQEQDQETQEIVTEHSDDNNRSFGELQEMMLNEINDQVKMQVLHGNQHLVMNEHDYMDPQLCENIENTRQNESKEDIEKEVTPEQDKINDTREESVSSESTRRSKRKMTQQKSDHRLSSDEENYFENLNLSSRLKRVQSEKSEKVFFVCYWCDKQFSSRELLREHMYSHEEVRKTLSLVSKSLEKVHKTPEKSSDLQTSCPTSAKSGSSGKRAHTCPHCGKEYFYLSSYEKHLKQHRKERKAMKEGTIPLEVSFHEDEDSLDFHNYDDSYAVDSDDEKEEKNKEKEDEKDLSNVHKEFPLEETIVEESSVTELETKQNLTDSTEQEPKLEENNEPPQKVDLSKKHKCPHCPSAFKQKNALSLHMRIHNKNNKTSRKVEQSVSIQPRSYLCTECKKNFGNEFTLKNHLAATGHKTTSQGEKYNVSKRIKRVAAKAALKVIDKINTDLNSEESEEENYKNEEKDADFEEVERKLTKSEQTQPVSSKSKKVQKTPTELFCATCNQKCSSKQALTKHMEQHSKEENSVKQEKIEKIEEIEDDDDYEGGIDDWPMESHECPTCGKKYSTKKSLLRHQLLHEEPNFECDICNVKFYRKDKLKAHYDKCSEKNPDQVRKCNICGDMFENNEILKDHRVKHVADGILTEEDLMEIDPKPEDKGEKYTPRKRRTDIVGLECTECNKQYTSRKGLLRHLQVHEGKKYLCDMCPKKFYRQEHLKIHVAKHNIVKPYKCYKCSKRFIKEELLNNHLLKHERIVKKPKDTSSDGSKRFLCEICSKSFTQSTTLVAHLRAHNGIKPYVCEVCSRPFTTNAYLKMHMRTHTQERPYICQYCSRAFARADTLANHLTSHTGEAKYHCKFCPKHFRRLKSLKEHVFIHTGQRPYACPTCDRKFNNNGSRYAHSKRCKQNQEQQSTQSQIVEKSVEQHLIIATTGEQEEQHQINQEVEPLQLVEQEGAQLQLVEQEVSPLQLVEQADLQDAQVTQQVVQRMGMVTTSSGQFMKPQNFKTITIARPVDGSLSQQHVVGQEILMPLILPFTVTYGDVGDEVILSETPKIFTT